MQNLELRSERLNRSFFGEIRHLLLEANPFDDDDYPMDKWRVSLQAPNGTEIVTFDYWTGIGHRTLIPLIMRTWHGDVRNSKWKDKDAWVKTIAHDTRPVTPKLDDILYSVVADSYAAETTFARWCAEFEYDTDSRKALATYEACQINADKLVRLGVNLAEARKAFEDY